MEDSAWDALLGVAKILTLDDTVPQFIQPSRRGGAGTLFARGTQHGRFPSESNGVPLAEGSRPKLLDQVRQTIRMRHYSRRTKNTYVHWIRRFIIFHQRRKISE
jgi:hypothetical protein